ncbi:hypothetical protein FSC46_25625, partial [Pseudomonas aeruginosa]
TPLRRPPRGPAAPPRPPPAPGGTPPGGFSPPTQAPTCFRRTGSPSCGRQATRVRFPVPAARR